MRLELNQRTDLAVRALFALAQRTGRTKAQDLAEELESTATYLPQVIAPLVAAGWVDSAPGPQGGYELTGDLDRITVLQLIEASEGPSDTGQCVLVGGPCLAGGPCVLHEPWSRARAALLDELASISLSSVPFPSGAPPGGPDRSPTPRSTP
jgi:Rrf2 family protein